MDDNYKGFTLMVYRQFLKANAVNTAAVRAQRQEEKRDAQSKAFDRETKALEGINKPAVGRVKGALACLAGSSF